MAAKELVVGRALGIEIRASRSWMVVVILVTAAMMLQFDAEFDHWGGVAIVAAGVATSLLLFASVFFHELAHCVAARWFGIRAKAVTLNFFGGMSSLSREAAKPIEEFVIAFAGPLVNIVLAVVFFAINLATFTVSEPVSTVAGFVGSLNAILAVFNLLPGLPLDGGRVLRSIVWWFTGSFDKSTRIAAVTGMGLAAVLLMLGIALLLGGRFDGIWLSVIGIYLYGRAKLSRFELDVRKALDGLTVGSMWLRTLPQIDRSATLEQFARQIAPGVDGTEDPHFMVVDEGVIWGVVAGSALTRVEPTEWSGTLIGEVMTPIDQLEKLSFQTEIMRALEAMNSTEIGELPVVENNAVQGFVGRDALLTFVSSRIGALDQQANT